MSVDRSPRGFYQRDATIKRAMLPGTFGGEIANTSPIDYGDVGKGSGASALVVSVDTTSGDLFEFDQFTLASNGAQTVTLTHTGVIEDSMHVYLNGIHQERITDWTYDGDVTLSVLTAMGALTSDNLAVRYAFTTSVPDDAEIG